VTALTLRGGTIVDGTGAASFVGNVIVEDERVVEVGVSGIQGTVLDVDGLVVAPGFVDIHSHADWIAPLPEGGELLAASVRQGITTTAAGNCGISPAPLGKRFRRGAIEQMLLVDTVTDRLSWSWRSVGEYLSELEQRGLPLNLCLYVGHSTLRATVLGELTRPATPSELDEMRTLLEQGLGEGAVGLSVGLEYFPGRYAGPSEVELLAAAAAAHDGLVAVHTRGISELFKPALEEAIGVARRAGCRLQIAHVNPMGRANWGQVDALLAGIDQARGEGLEVGFDIIGYTAWTLTAFEALPHVVQELGDDAVVALCASPEGRTYLRGLVEQAWPVWPPWVEGRVTRNVLLEMGWEALVLADEPTGFASQRSRSLGEIASSRGNDPFEVYFDLVAASQGKARIVNVGYGGDFEDDMPLRRLVARPDAIPETDTVPVRTNGSVALPLPLFHGTMTRFLGHFSRELGLVPLEQAVQRITRLPAERLRLEGRGLLREGAFADLVVFDPATIADRGTFLDPEPPAGIEYVFVNGQQVVSAGVYDAERRAGHALRPSPAQAVKLP
jgi:N-acyl-D-amino-acid deacylase